MSSVRPVRCQDCTDVLSCNHLSGYFSFFPRFLQLFSRSPPCSKSVPGSVSVLDIKTLDRELFIYGLLARSRSTYSSAKRQYLSFCQHAGTIPLPISEWRYLLFLAKLRSQFISSYQSAVHHLEIEVGSCTLRGVARLSEVATQLPMTLNIMILIRGQ